MLFSWPFHEATILLLWIWWQSWLVCVLLIGGGPLILGIKLKRLKSVWILIINRSILLVISLLTVIVALYFVVVHLSLLEYLLRVSGYPLSIFFVFVWEFSVRQFLEEKFLGLIVYVKSHDFSDWEYFFASEAKVALIIVLFMKFYQIFHHWEICCGKWVGS